MFKFTMSALMLNNILSATSSKGHVFVLPSNDGITFTNTLEEDDISVYNIINSNELVNYEYDRDEDDAYCFIVNDIVPLISRIKGLVTLSFDSLNNESFAYIHIKAENGKFEGKTALKDEETMEDILGLTENKKNARFHHRLDFNDQIIYIPKPMNDIGNSKILHFEQPLKPLIVESDNVIISIDLKTNEFLEHIKTETSEYNFKEMFDKSLFMNDKHDKLTGKVTLNVTSSFLEGAIKKHPSLISNMILIDLPSEMIPYNIIFLSMREVEQSTFYTASILSLRTKTQIN